MTKPTKSTLTASPTRMKTTVRTTTAITQTTTATSTTTVVTKVSAIMTTATVEPATTTIMTTTARVKIPGKMFVNYFKEGINVNPGVTNVKCKPWIRCKILNQIFSQLIIILLRFFFVPRLHSLSICCKGVLWWTFNLRYSFWPCSKSCRVEWKIKMGT